MFIDKMAELLKGKTIFLDVDGTLGEYRYNNHVCGDDGNGQTYDELLFDDIFYRARPLKTMMELVSKLDSENLYVLGASVTNYEIDQKYQWLAEHYPNIKRENMIFVGASSIKSMTMKKYMENLNLKPSDIVFIDDNHNSIKDAETNGFISYHISSFIE